MATLESRIVALAQAIGLDVKTITQNMGVLSALATADKTSLVAAINEVRATSGGGGSIIDDGAAATNRVWSSQKTNTEIAAAVAAIVASSPAALDTLNELAAALGNDASFATTMATALGNRVRVDAAQTFTAAQQLQACQNIGVGNYARDFAADYAAAKA